MSLFDKGKHKDPDPNIRLQAVEKLKDKDELVELACNDKSQRVRMAAVSHLIDDQHLAKIARHAKELDVRMMAVERIASQQLLADVVLARENLELVGICFSRLTDRKVIESIANNPKCNPVVRRMAVEHFADESYLDEASEAATKEAEEDPGRKSESAVNEFLDVYGGGVGAVRAIGRFKRSEKALKALGTIASRGGECGELAVEYLCSALGSSNESVKECASDELARLTNPELVGYLIRALDNHALREPIRKVLNEINTPEARDALGE